MVRSAHQAAAREEALTPRMERALAVKEVEAQEVEARELLGAETRPDCHTSLPAA